MRVVVVLLVVLLLATGCASGSTRKSPTATQNLPVTTIDYAKTAPDYVATLPPDEGEEIVGTLLQHYVYLATKRCPDRSDACLNAQVAKDFDPRGELAPLCKSYTVAFDYQFCLIIAAEHAPMIAAAGEDPATAVDWTDIDTTDSESRKVFMAPIMLKCGEDMPCIVNTMAAELNLSPAIAKSCQTHQPYLAQFNCIVNAQGATIYHRAIKSVSTPPSL